MAFYRSQHRVYFTNAHSDVLEALGEWGLPAGAVLLCGGWMLIRSLRRLAKARARSAGGPDHVELMSAGLVVLAIMASTNFPFRIALVAYPAILFMSWIFAAEREAAR